MIALPPDPKVQYEWAGETATCGWRKGVVNDTACACITECTQGREEGEEGREGGRNERERMYNFSAYLQTAG